MKKGLYQFCQDNLRAFSGQLKCNASLKKLALDYQFGVVKADMFFWNEQDRDYLINRVKQETGLTLFRDPYQSPKSRLQSAKTARNEKINSYPVSQNYILLNSITTLNLNQQRHLMSPFTSFGIYIDAQQIQSVEHQQIVLVENLQVMASLKQLVIPEHLKDALWLYRGDIKDQHSSSRAYQFFRSLAETHQLICFSDLDPAGIEIAISSGAVHWLTPIDSAIIDISLSGDENEFYKQEKAITFLNKKKTLPDKCKNSFQLMLELQKTLKQEHMITHQIPLNLFSL